MHGWLAHDGCAHKPAAMEIKTVHAVPCRAVGVADVSCAGSCYSIGLVNSQLHHMGCGRAEKLLAQQGLWMHIKMLVCRVHGPPTLLYEAWPITPQQLHQLVVVQTDCMCMIMGVRRADLRHNRDDQPSAEA